MAILTRVADAARVVLEAEHTIGRSHECRLTLPAGYISAQHAVIRWTGDRWELRDLASTNGTFVDGERLRPAESRALAPGTVIRFGRADEEWRLTDASPPLPTLVPEDGGDPIPLAAGILALPSAADPAATLYLHASGVWRLERADDTVAEIPSGRPFVVAGRTFRLAAPAALARTSAAEAGADLRGMRLAFGVSRDEEHVEISIDDGATVRPLPVRAHNYLLLLLARRRLADAAAGHPPTACGWTFKDDLLRGLDVMPNQLNIDIFRLRQQFASMGIPNAADIVERRASTKELRIGVARLEIATL